MSPSLNLRTQHAAPLPGRNCRLIGDARHQGLEETNECGDCCPVDRLGDAVLRALITGPIPWVVDALAFAVGL